MRRLIASLLALAALPAMAGDIYTCKGARGETVYQNTPCAPNQAQVAHTTFVKPAPAPAADYRDETAAAEPPVATGTPVAPSYEPLPRVQEPSKPVAYACLAGNRRWMQYTPCPADVPVTRDVDVSGYTDSGQHVNGWGTVMDKQAVKSTPVDNQQVCAMLDGRTPIRGAGDDAGQSYERNKLKRKYCGG